jgi:hypothetical protein
MRTIQVLLMRLDDGYRAVAQGFGMLDGYTLEGFRSRIREAITKRLRSEAFEFEFALSPDLRPDYPACARCGGTERVETDGIAGQYLSSEFGSIDWSKRATVTCPTCEGLGVFIANF